MTLSILLAFWMMMQHCNDPDGCRCFNGLCQPLSSTFKLDVPAIQTEREIPSGNTETCISITLNSDGTMEEPKGCKPAKTVVKYWTCADKSRILLTAEDGTKHCIKFGASEIRETKR